MNKIVDKYVDEVIDSCCRILNNANIDYIPYDSTGHHPMFYYFTIKKYKKHSTYLKFRFASIINHPIVEYIEFNPFVGDIVIHFIHGYELKNFIRKEKLRKLFQINEL